MATQNADRTGTDVGETLTMAELFRLAEVTEQDPVVSRGIMVLVQMAHRRGWAKGFLLGTALTILACTFLTYIL